MKHHPWGPTKDYYEVCIVYKNVCRLAASLPFSDTLICCSVQHTRQPSAVICLKCLRAKLARLTHWTRHTFKPLTLSLPAWRHADVSVYLKAPLCFVSSHNAADSYNTARLLQFIWWIQNRRGFFLLHMGEWIILMQLLRLDTKYEAAVGSQWA